MQYDIDEKTTDQVTWCGGSSPIIKQDKTGINAHTLTVFEPSPLNRVLESFAPGKSWEGISGSPTETAHHSTKQKYWTNTATDNVKYWTVSFVATPQERVLAAIPRPSPTPREHFIKVSP